MLIMLMAIDIDISVPFVIWVLRIWGSDVGKAIISDQGPEGMLTVYLEIKRCVMHTGYLEIGTAILILYAMSIP